MTTPENLEELANDMSICDPGYENCREYRAEIARLKEELASFAQGVKINIPTATMEYEFQAHYRRGYQAAEARIAELTRERDEALHIAEVRFTCITKERRERDEARAQVTALTRVVDAAKAFHEVRTMFAFDSPAMWAAANALSAALTEGTPHD